jgi:cytochrome bd ubiquinol oxidase subunit II
VPEIPAGEPAMLWVVIPFLGASLLLYCLLAGADFGAGILELFLGRENRREQRRIIDRALGPVWEANHIWLILMVVILFMGFPAVYARVSTQLHLPLTAMLMGIIARGCAFTFRHYDAVQGRSQRPYTFFFVWSSLWTPFCLGVVTGALVPGGIDPAAANYFEGYVRPWLRPFPLALGVFTACLFAFLAAAYLIGESPQGPVRRRFARRAAVCSAAAVAAGVLVFAAAERDGVGLARRFASNPWAAGGMMLATLLLPWLWYCLAAQRVWPARVLAGAQTALILAAWFAVQFPVLVKVKGGPDLTFFNAHAPAAVLDQLGWALLAGGALILPALAWLLKVFKAEAG